LGRIPLVSGIAAGFEGEASVTLGTARHAGMTLEANTRL